MRACAGRTLKGLKRLFENYVPAIKITHALTCHSLVSRPRNNNAFSTDSCVIITPLRLPHFGACPLGRKRGCRGKGVDGMRRNGVKGKSEEIPKASTYAKPVKKFYIYIFIYVYIKPYTNKTLKQKNSFVWRVKIKLFKYSHKRAPIIICFANLEFICDSPFYCYPVFFRSKLLSLPSSCIIVFINPDNNNQSPRVFVLICLKTFCGRRKGYIYMIILNNLNVNKITHTWFIIIYLSVYVLYLSMFCMAQIWM